jgi:glycosyltransferase involved in cell wall biosynthesis
LSNPDRRLAGVNYRSIAVGTDRLAFTRFHAWFHLWMTTRASAWANLVPAAIAPFEPEAVLTVVHGHAWAAAAAFAQRRGLPLHLIVHDDWPRMAAMPRGFAARVDDQLGPVYRAAASRLCVSPWMAEEYERRYGAKADVMYPSRGRSTDAHAVPPDRLGRQHGALTVAFAGTIRAPEHYRLLRTVATALRASGGRVLVFGPMTVEQAAAQGLNESNVHFNGMIDSRQLAATLREEADALLVPMSFDPADAANMRVSFPSKLVDYTAVGVPLLVCAPEYASAVQWARQYPGVAEVLLSPGPAAVEQALAKLTANPAYRVQLAARAIEVGTQLFSHQAAWTTLTGALRAAHPGQRVA